MSAIEIAFYPRPKVVNTVEILEANAVYDSMYLNQIFLFSNNETETAICFIYKSGYY